MNHSPLTAAALGPKIGLLVCVFGGCQPPSDEPTPATEAEFTATKFEVLTKRADDLDSRVNKLETEPKSCPLPEVGKADIESLQKQIDALKPKSKSTKKTAAKTPVDDAIDKATDAGHGLLIVCRQTKCVPCDTFENNQLADLKRAVEGKYDVITVNIDTDSDAASRFEINRTPTVVIYNTETRKYQTFTPGNSLGGTLATIGVAPPVYIRRRLLP